MVKDENNKVTKFNDNLMSIINAVSMLITYIVIGFILYFENNFFGSVTKAIVIGFTVVGLLGIVTEGSRLNLNYKLKGLDNSLVGAVILVLFYLMRTFIKISDCNEYVIFTFQVVLFLFMLTGIFIFSKGIIEMVCSICVNSKDKSLGSIVSSVLIMLAQVVAIIVLVLQIFKIVI